MTESHKVVLFENIAEAVPEMAQDSILSRTVSREDGVKAILFAFAPGQELSEHTAAVPALIQILEGDCAVTLGEEHYDAHAGFWAHMPAKLPHSITARTPVKMLLIMLPK